MAGFVGAAVPVTVIEGESVEGCGWWWVRRQVAELDVIVVVSWRGGRKEGFFTGGWSFAFVVPDVDSNGACEAGSKGKHGTDVVGRMDMFPRLARGGCEDEDEHGGEDDDGDVEKCPENKEVKISLDGGLGIDWLPKSRWLVRSRDDMAIFGAVCT